MRRALAVLGAALPLLLHAGSASSDGKFTIAVIPDTQNYADYRHQTAAGFAFDASELFLRQMDYIARNAKSRGGDIVFATALGDMWQHPTMAIDPAHERRGFRRVPNPFFDTQFAPTAKAISLEMPVVKRGYERIAGNIPFSVVPGNHDYDAVWTDPRFPPSNDAEPPAKLGISHVGGLDNFRSVFSHESAFFKGQAWYVDAHDGGADSAQIFTAGGYRFLHIGLQFDAPDASLKWAAAVLRRFPRAPTIVSTHNYLDPSNERLAGPILDNHAIDPDDNTPQMVWDELINRHDQIFMVLSGHRPTNGLRVERNRFGHEVYQILSDFQSRQQTAKAARTKAPAGGIGDGWMRLMTFDLESPTPSVRVRTYSTHYEQFSTELPQYVDWYKADENPGLTDAQFHARDDFTLTLDDFRTRFGVPEERKAGPSKR